MARRKYDALRSVPGKLIFYVRTGRVYKDSTSVFEEIIRIDDEPALHKQTFPSLGDRQARNIVRRLNEQGLGKYANRIQEHLQQYYSGLDEWLVISRH